MKELEVSKIFCKEESRSRRAFLKLRGRRQLEALSSLGRYIFILFLWFLICDENAALRLYSHLYILLDWSSTYYTACFIKNTALKCQHATRIQGILFMCMSVLLLPFPYK